MNQDASTKYPYVCRIRRCSTAILIVLNLLNPLKHCALYDEPYRADVEKCLVGSQVSDFWRPEPSGIQARYQKDLAVVTNIQCMLAI